jgi:hypothetical protein
MSTIFSDADAGAGSKVIGKPAESSIAATVGRNPIWPKVVIVTGLLATIAWTGLLAWVVLRMIFGVL